MIKIKSVTDVITNSSSEVFLIKPKDGKDLSEFEREFLDHVKYLEDNKEVYMSGEACGVEYPHYELPWEWKYISEKGIFENPENLESWKKYVKFKYQGFDNDALDKLNIESLAILEQKKSMTSKVDAEGRYVQIDNGYREKVLDWLADNAVVCLPFPNSLENYEYSLGGDRKLVFDYESTGHVKKLTEEELQEQKESKIQDEIVNNSPAIYGSKEQMKRWVELQEGKVTEEDWIKESIEQVDSSIKSFKEDIQRYEQLKETIKGYANKD